MGNSNSNLSIVLNPSEGPHPEWYTAGSKLSGTVHAKTNKQVEGFDLKVIFTGKENTEVIDQWSDKGNRYFEKIDIVRLSFSLFENHLSLDVGQYAFPFEIQLPDNLPTSMKCKTKLDDKCSIVYKIQAQTTGKWRHATNKIVVCILAKPEPSSSPHLVSPITRTIRLCGCARRGQISFAAKVDNTRVGIGENVTISFGCKNNSSKKIKYVSVKLVQHAKWKAKSHTAKLKKVIAKQTLPLDEGMVQCTKVQMKQIQDSNNHQSCETKNSLCNKLQETVRAGKNQTTITVPDVPITYDGLRIFVAYVLVIKIKTPMFSSNVRKEIEMFIVEPQSVQMHTDLILQNSETNKGYNATTPSAPSYPTGWDEKQAIVSPVTTYSDNSVLTCIDVDVEQEEPVTDFLPVKSDDLIGPEPSLLILKKELEKSLRAKSTVQDKLTHANWAPVFRDLQPNDFADVVATVKIEIDQVDVAELVASAVERFSCQYVVAMLRSSCDWLRVEFVQKLLPFCVDVNENSNSILDELNEWEKMCTRMDFDKILK